MGLSHNPPTSIANLVFYFDATNPRTWTAGTPASGVGEAVYTTPGTYSWTCPAGVFSVSTVCVGGGGENIGAGGGLGWKNNISVVPGNTYNVVVGERGNMDESGNNGNSYFINVSTVMGGGVTSARIGGTYVGDGGGRGGNTAYIVGFSGAGAGGYSGKGGDGTGNRNGAGGGGGGGANEYPGGGVGIYGEGASGAGGIPGGTGNQVYGKGGSGGEDGRLGNGGRYGGGGGYFGTGDTFGANGAVRLVWPGDARRFPSIGVANNSVSNNIIGIINKGFTYTANNLVYETENRGRLKFSGNSSFITTTYTLTAGQALTVMGWLYSTETTAIYRNFFDSATNNPMIWWDETGKIEFDAGTYLTASTYRNQWTHVSISKPSGSGAPSYYVNGSLVGSGNSYSVPAVTPSFFYENGNNNEAWKGYATVVQLYDRALSDLEIYNNYTVHRGRFGI